MLYGPGARLYDRFTDLLFLGEWRRWQEATLRYLPADGLVVELGCGTGRLAASGHGPGRSWLGLDRSPAMLRVARRRSRHEGPWFVRGDARMVPVGDAVATAVVCAFPTEYILDPVVGAEVARVLAPGAPLVVILSGTLAPWGRRRRLHRRALAAFYGATGRDPAELALAGLAGRQETIPTTGGQALIYVGYAVARGGSER